MNRRSLFGVIALSPIMAVEAFAKEKPTGEPLEDSVKMTLMGAKKKDGTMMYLGNGSSMMLGNFPQYDPDKQVSMAVGDDGNLWLKRTDGEWRKVVTE
jgi:hypothetical protein